MRLAYSFEADEIDAVKRIVEDKLASGRRFVQYRFQHNVEGTAPQNDDEALWTAHMMCLLTTQQRSGPDSAINVFLERDPFPLSLEACRNYASLQDSALHILTEAQGIRRTNKIAKAVYRNWAMLEQGEWRNLHEWRDILMAQRAELPNPTHRSAEESAADYMNRFLEFGPKQSRNFWQSLGLTRYTFVLDSRILRWLRKHLRIEVGLLTVQGLGDSDYYRFISDILLDLCNQADVLPCMLDAAVFDSFDEDAEWTADVIW
ncbi:hypothetical protein KJZ71_03975 [Patescibacteria group bacterium]|nr:hypothetical protein [Patescibacteria group bacterium]